MANNDETRYGELLSVVDEKDPKTRWTPKKRRFCFWMARLGNAVEASQRAGYQGEKYGNTLMMEAGVRHQVQMELRSLLSAEAENEDTVVARWARWANADIGDYFDVGWQLRDIGELGEESRKCIKKVKITENQFGRNIDFELHDAHRANNDLAVMMGLLGKTDDGKKPAEETAKSIQQMLKEMQEVDGLQEPVLEGSTESGSTRTH